ncbi:MAG: hypothetical protein Q7S20_00840, partial [Gemmatimonadaceae bacterium]|nr:hypothetical protein [Gemmatimonadaceae bacterium]
RTHTSARNSSACDIFVLSTDPTPAAGSVDRGHFYLGIKGTLSLWFNTQVNLGVNILSNANRNVTHLTPIEMSPSGGSVLQVFLSS